MILLLEVLLHLFGQALVNIVLELFGESLNRIPGVVWSRRAPAAIFSMVLAFVLGGLWGDYVGGTGRLATPKSVWTSGALAILFLGLSFAARKQPSPAPISSRRSSVPTIVVRSFTSWPPWRLRVLCGISIAFGVGVFVGFDPAAPLR